MSKLKPKDSLRIIVLQGLYALEVGGLADNEMKGCLAEQSANPGQLQAALDLISSIQGCRDEIDDDIRSVLENWKLERLAKVDKNLLRLGAYQLKHMAPEETESLTEIVNSCLDIIKVYGDRKSSGFINGVLDALWRKYHKTNLL